MLVFMRTLEERTGLPWSTAWISRTGDVRGSHFSWEKYGEWRGRIMTAAANFANGSTDLSHEAWLLTKLVGSLLNILYSDIYSTFLYLTNLGKSAH